MAKNFSSFKQWKLKKQGNESMDDGQLQLMTKIIYITQR